MARRKKQEFYQDIQTEEIYMFIMKVDDIIYLEDESHEIHTFDEDIFVEYFKQILEKE